MSDINSKSIQSNKIDYINISFYIIMFLGILYFIFLGYLSHGETIISILLNDKNDEYYGVAEPPVRKNESHYSGPTEPPFFTLTVPASFHKLPS